MKRELNFISLKTVMMLVSITFVVSSVVILAPTLMEVVNGTYDSYLSPISDLVFMIIGACILLPCMILLPSHKGKVVLNEVEGGLEVCVISNNFIFRKPKKQLFLKYNEAFTFSSKYYTSSTSTYMLKTVDEEISWRGPSNMYKSSPEMLEFFTALSVERDSVVISKSKNSVTLTLADNIVFEAKGKVNSRNNVFKLLQWLLILSLVAYIGYKGYEYYRAQKAKEEFQATINELTSDVDLKALLEESIK